MKKPDESVLKAIQGLQTNTAWKTVVRWFEESLSEQDKSNRPERDITTLHQGQGKALNMNEFLMTVESASDTLKHIRKAPEKQAQTQAAQY
jgi:hypothetical protein